MVAFSTAPPRDGNSGDIVSPHCDVRIGRDRVKARSTKYKLGHAPGVPGGACRPDRISPSRI
jgi:enoyl-CoA hydratase/carnithine racemase